MPKKVVKDIQINGKDAVKGERMTKGSKWKLTATTGKERTFNGTLLGTHNIGNVRIAIFDVPK